MGKSAASSVTGLLHRTRLHLLLLLFLGIVAYSNTFDTPFVFDDARIMENLRIRDISSIPSMFTDIDGEVASRPLMLASFALNYHAGGFDTWGYHAVNLALHLLNGALLYFVVLLTGRQTGYREEDTRLVAVFASLMFVLHPVQTEAVTYTISRSMLLATNCYLLGVILFLRAVTAEKRRGLYVAGLFLVSLMGMASRENFITFPLMLFLYDLFFISRFSIREAARHYRAHLLVISTMAYMAFLVLSYNYPQTAGFGIEKTTPLEYLTTQFNVHWTYLRLLVLPVGQNLDYDYLVAKTLFEFPTLLSFLGYLGLWAGSIFLARKRPLISFSILWFLITLAPASSIVPLDDVIFEHRLYLPSAGLFILGVALSVKIANSPLARGVLIPTLIIISLTLGGAAYARNAVWFDGLSLWSDVVKKSPNKARGYGNLALNYRAAGQTDTAIELYKKAIAIDPGYADYYINLGALYADKGQRDIAIRHLRAALALEPDSVNAHYNIATLYLKSQPELAAEHFSSAIGLDPEFMPAHYNLGILYLQGGAIDKAITQLEAVKRLRPDFIRGYYNLGRAYEIKGLPEKAIEQYLLARRLNPDLPELHLRLADAYLAAGDKGKADEHLLKYEVFEGISP